MGDRSSIEWTRSDDGSPGATWNPLRGTTGRWACVQQSPGCLHCYASTMNHRFGGPAYPAPGQPLADAVRLDERTLYLPFTWRKPRRVFVCSMTDIAGEWVEYEWFCDLFTVMADLPQHTFQVLTKRPKRLKEFVERWYAEAREHGTSPWPEPLPNVWLGVSVELNRFSWRAYVLADTPAAVRFVSAEPLLGSLPSLEVSGVDWVIAGAESGPGARPMDEDWVRDLRDRCGTAGTKFFYKQRLSGGKKIGLPELDGRVWADFPAAQPELVGAAR